MEISKRKIKILMAKQALTVKALAERMNTQANKVNKVCVFYPNRKVNSLQNYLIRKGE